MSEAPYDLKSALSYWKDEFKITKIVCLLEDYQLCSWLGIDPQDYAEEAADLGMQFTRFPIPDLEVPKDKGFFYTFMKSEIVSQVRSKP